MSNGVTENSAWHSRYQLIFDDLKKASVLSRYPTTTLSYLLIAL